MDVVPPEYDELTKQRVYRQEWLEHFHYIGFDAAKRDFPAQYHALFPHGHHRSNNAVVAPSAAGLAATATSTDVTAAGTAEPPVSLEDLPKAALSSSPSSVPTTPRTDSRRVTETDHGDTHDGRSERSGRTYSHRRDRDDKRMEHNDGGSRESRRRHREESERRHRSHRHSPRDEDREHRHRRRSRSDDSTRRRRRSDDREDRRGHRTRGEDSRRARRESGSSRSYGYDDRREDALRRRETRSRR